MTDATMAAANLASGTVTQTTGAISRGQRPTIFIDLRDNQVDLRVLDGEGTILDESRPQTSASRTSAAAARSVTLTEAKSQE